MSSPPLQDKRRDAVIDGEYRYRLSRTWDVSKPTVTWVMLNPSTADDIDDDNTIRRCLSYSQDWGFGSLVVGNLFALRTKNPSNLRDHPDPVGPENDSYLQAIVDDAELVVAAWGANGSLASRGREVATALNTNLHALDTTKAGHPVHPLYQPGDAQPHPYSPEALCRD